MRYLPLLLLLLVGCAQISEEPPAKEEFSPKMIKYDQNSMQIAAADDDTILLVYAENLSKYTEISENGGAKIIEIAWMGDALASLQRSGGGCVEDEYCIKLWNASTGQSIKTIKLGTKISDQDPSDFPNASEFQKPYQIVRIIDMENGETSKKAVPVDDLKEIYSSGGMMKIVQTIEGERVYLLPDNNENGMFGISAPLAWGKNGTAIAGYDYVKKELDIYSFGENVSLQKSIKMDIEEILARRLGYGINEMRFSPDGKLIAISGTYSISAGPSIAHVSGLGFVIIVDVGADKIRLVDSGGVRYKDNEAYFDWSPDGKLAYIFEGEPLDKLRIFDPEH